MPLVVGPLEPRGCARPNGELPVSSALLSCLAPAHAGLAADRALQRRTERKYVLPARRIEPLIAALRTDYVVLLAGGAAVATYDTLYFDTPGLRCFHDQRRGRRAHHKVRVRHYPERAIAFLEIKTRRRDGTSTKHRRERALGDNTLSATDRALIAACCDVPAAELAPQLWTRFRRLTLLGRTTAERVTVDMDLRVDAGHRAHALPGVVFVEVKQAAPSQRTPVMRAIDTAGLRSVTVSKYCLATTLVSDGVRVDGIARALRAVDRAAR